MDHSRPHQNLKYIYIFAVHVTCSYSNDVYFDLRRLQTKYHSGQSFTHTQRHVHTKAQPTYTHTHTYMHARLHAHMCACSCRHARMLTTHYESCILCERTEWLRTQTRKRIIITLPDSRRKSRIPISNKISLRTYLSG